MPDEHKPKYRIEVFMYIPPPEDEQLFDDLLEAKKEARHLEDMQPENIYKVVEVD